MLTIVIYKIFWNIPWLILKSFEIALEINLKLRYNFCSLSSQEQKSLASALSLKLNCLLRNTTYLGYKDKVESSPVEIQKTPKLWSHLCDQTPVKKVRVHFNFLCLVRKLPHSLFKNWNHSNKSFDIPTIEH